MTDWDVLLLRRRYSHYSPQTSDSTPEMRADLLGLTVALLAISETQASCFGKDASWVVNVG